MKNIIFDVVREIKGNFNDEIADVFLMTKGDKELMNDWDFILIVNKDVDIFEMIKRTSVLCVQLIEKQDEFISFFPLKQSKFENSNSMFVKNVKLYGKSIF